MCSYAFCLFNDTATTEIYTLSLHDALPISLNASYNILGVLNDDVGPRGGLSLGAGLRRDFFEGGDRKSTRLNSSHANISYAVFCLKKKKIDWSFSPTKKQ